MNHLYMQIKNGQNEKVCEVVGFIKAYIKDLHHIKEISKKVVGIIIRNEMGIVMGACICPMRNIKDLTTIEAYASLQVVVFVEEMGFRDVEIDEVPLDIELIVSMDKERIVEGKRDW
ncbi:hypothetical protein Golob_000859 [Gossypium lobatum]|uniref:Uncharacterized protein n=1 Tax=Gossypium lobatum TaxID=34289 RepID=A0A7J8N9G4_9ROSI|nr:hypothetical protein [Gossypium lobatum]